MRHVEIETVNRKLLENMSKIMSNDYKSAVKTAMSNRKLTKNYWFLGIDLHFDYLTTFFAFI